MDIEVLVATMHQKDFSKVEEMNIQSDVLFVNQSDENSYKEIITNKKNTRMISNRQRGLSRSRNEALLHAQGDICLIGDEDIRYKDNYQETVREAFEKLPQAEMIIFNTTMINTANVPKRKEIIKIRRAPKHRSYGSVRIAFKREEVLKRNVWFNIYFGAGAKFSSGEESLFIRELIRKKIKIYEYPECIAEVDYSKSTWFTGYDEKFFYDKGAYLAVAHPIMKYIYRYYYIYKLKKFSSITLKECLQCMKRGITEYSLLKSYEEYMKDENQMINE